MTKALILNVGGPNKGNLALVYSTIETIKRFDPNIEFSLMGPRNIDHNGLQIKRVVGWGPSIRKPHYTIISLLSLIKCVCIHIFRRFGLHVPISKDSRLFEYYDSDIIVNSGGDSMSGESGINIGASTNILYAILLNKPVVLYGESLGHFTDPISNYIAKFIFNRTNLILVREELSKKYLDDNNITRPKIYATADPAFLLNPVPQSRIFEILSNEGIKEIQKPLIGINPSGLISRFMRGSHKKAEEEFSNIIARVIDNLVEHLNATIIMIPHVYGPTNKYDDRTIINRIFHKVKNKSNVKKIKSEYAPQELKGIIGECDLFIGARMHATIASTSMLVPTVGIAYSHKMHGIIGEMLRQEKYILDIKELSYESLTSKINDAWNNREKIKKELEMKIPMIKEKAMLNGKLVKELLDFLKTS